MDWKRLTLLALLLAGCGSPKSDNDDDDDDVEFGDNSAGDSSSCSTTLDIYEAYAFAPSVVRLAFRLFCGDTNIGDKTATDFEILEDGDAVSAYESELTMVPITASFQLSTALVLDMSGSMLESGRLPQLLDAVSAFINTTESDQEIGIYLFDGRENLTTLQPFTSNKSVLLESVDTLNEYESVDSSTNLNGAIVRGLALLDAEEAEHEDLTFGGTLAVFTDGTDQAGRVSDDAAVTAVEASSHSVYSVGLGGEADSAHLADVGKSGALLAANVDELSTAFENLAESIRAQTAGFYVIAYCSPKRAGRHTLEIRLDGTNASAGVEFNADGFDSGCDPTDFVPSGE
jgi:uncharacterized protein YegL